MADSWKLSDGQKEDIWWPYYNQGIRYKVNLRLVADNSSDAACKHLAEKVLAEIWFMTGNIDYCKRLTEKFRAEGILGKEGE